LEIDFFLYIFIVGCDTYFSSFSELCASVVFVGQKSKRLVNGNDTQVPS